MNYFFVLLAFASFLQHTRADSGTAFLQQARCLPEYAANSKDREIVGFRCDQISSDSKLNRFKVQVNDMIVEIDGHIPTFVSMTELGKGQHLAIKVKRGGKLISLGSK